MRAFRRWLPVKPRLRYHIRYGRKDGFPPCCIAWFCCFSWLPHRAFDNGWWWRLLRVPGGRGFIPCPLHYRDTESMSHMAVKFIAHGRPSK